MPKWTAEQQQAIEAMNKTILVSAAAGSGKTAVLVERIVTLIKKGFRLNRMLIVTFTRAAAGEMRQRLNQRLTKEALSDPKIMGRALDDLEGTDISTIHAFCQKVIRSEFQAVGIDPLVRVCDEQQKNLLFDEAYRMAANQLLDEEGHPALELLMSAFKQNETVEMTKEVYAFLMSMPEPFEWMKNKIDAMDFEGLREHPWYQTIKNKVKLELLGAPLYLKAMEQLFDEPGAINALRQTMEKDQMLMEGLLKQAEERPEALAELLSETKFATAARTSKLTAEEEAWKERFKKTRDEMKKLVSSAQGALDIDEEKQKHDLRQIQVFLTGLYDLTKRTHELFLKKKNQQHVMDFGDMEQMTLAILSMKEHREALQTEYDHIFVDECQDVSAVQDAIIQLIHGPESILFMVGDVKQSIYRFRLADPTLFLHRMRTFSDDEDAAERRIFLQKNFRSRNNVLDASNRVFRSAMRRNVTELDYLPEDELVPGRETENDPPVEIRLIAPKEEKSGSEEKLKSEAACVVRRIRELLETNFDDGKRQRKYQYRDMVILLAKVSGVGARLTEILEEQGIPVFFDGKDDYYQLPEIRSMRELLRVIDNPMQDVALLTVLKMIPFSMQDGELAQVRMCRQGRNVPFYEAFEAACEENSNIGERCRRIKEQLAEWRFLCDTMQLSDFIWYLVRKTGFYAVCGAYPEGELRQANLRLLCHRAAEYETIGDGTLSGFLRMIQQQIQSSDSKSAKILGENENLVRIMTMHKSKGLEFPVVFCMCLTDNMNGAHGGILRMHSNLGLCLPYVNEKMNIRRETMGSDAFRHQKRLDEIAERCRLLYVAMTRARERLILTGCCEEREKLNWRMDRGDYRVWNASCMMDWVMQAVTDDLNMDSEADEIQGGPWLLVREEAEELQEMERQTNIRETTEWIRRVISIPARKDTHAWWQETAVPAKSEPLKTSVSSIARHEVMNDPMPITDEEETPEEKRLPAEASLPLRMSELPSRPAFLEEKKMTGAERGTLMHHLLSLLPLEKLRGKTGQELTDCLWEETSRLCEEGCFDAGEMTMVRMSDVRTYFAGELGQRMLRSDNVRREWGFNLRISREKGTLLQGIIDCAFEEDGKWILVDYKTDRIESEEAFVQKHQLQLNWYARALEEITGREVTQLWLWSLSRGKAYPVEKRSVGE